MPQPGPESIRPWTGTAGMALGTLCFVGRGWTVEGREQQLFSVVTTFVTARAFASCFAMAPGFGGQLLCSRVVLEQAARPVVEAVAG